MPIEKDTKQFFIKITQSVFIIMLWMMLNIFAGIYKGYAFFEDTPNWANYLYYLLSLVGLVFVINYLYRKWK